jgi:hypothetical protein
MNIKPLSNAARRIWGVFLQLKAIFTNAGKAQEDAFAMQEKQIEFEEKKIIQYPESKNYLTQDIKQKKLRLEKEKEEFYTFKTLIDNLPPNKTPEYYFDILRKILYKLNREESTMRIGKLYTFKYVATTQGKWYDLHPVAIITSKFDNGWKGLNYHWERNPEYIENPIRSYVFTGVRSRFYNIEMHELEYILQVPSFLPIFINKR